jgi:flavocytochrome c
MSKITRRSFLKGAAVAGAAAAGVGLVSCAPQAASGPAKWDEESDVVVIGSGFAGLAAAIEAAQAGAAVRVLEKMPTVGGNSAINGGAVAAVNSPLQQAQGIEDTADLMFADMLRAGLDLNHRDLARIVAENCKDAVQWTIDELGVEYTDRLVQFGGHSVPRSYSTVQGTGFGIVKQELSKLEELGIEVELNKKVTRLFLDENGRVAGVEYLDDYDRDTDSGEPKTLKANRAIVVASGGFGQDVPFRQVQDPRLDDSLDCTNHSGATAEVLVAMLEADAMPVQLSWIQLGPWASPDEKGFGLVPWFSVPAGSPWGVIVDPETGQRFVNELTDRKRKADAIVATGHPAINVCDAEGFAKIPPSWDVSPAVERDVILKADTLEEIAEHYDMPVDAFLAEIERYNAFVEAGQDEAFEKPIPEGAQPIDTPPFYAARLWPKVHHCMGGVRINPEAQVLDLNGEPVSGLYAAGEVTGGIHGATRLGSVATADCIVFGRIAGRNAAGEESAA